MIRTLEDIRSIESAPYDQWAGAASTFELLAQSARRDPDGTALLYARQADDADSLMRWSFADLLRDVQQAAGLLRSLGVRRGDRVALLAPNMPSTHVALWGTQLAGCVFPVNYLLSAEHIAQLLKAADAQVVIALGPDPRLPIHQNVARAVQLAGSVRHVLTIDPDEGAPAVDSFQARLRGHGGAVDAAQWLAAAGQPSAAEVPRSGDLAALFHTGGTTGLPKLLQHSHRNEVHTSRAAAGYYDFGPGDVMLNGFPLFHVAGTFVYGLSCLAAGGSLFLPTLTGMRNPEFVRRAWQWLERCKVTHLGCVPTMLSQLLDVPRRPGQAPALRVAMTGGSPLPNELAVRFETAFGVPVRNIFGMTECAGIVSIEPVAAPRAAGSVGLRLPYSEVVAVPIGEAGAGVVGRRCAAGETGVVAIRGPHVSAGYLDRARNAGSFTADGWLLSGDLGHVDSDGRIFLTGRAKDLIIRSGHNIDPALIEDAFIAHPDVATCAAVGEPDRYAGELPVVFVTLKAGVHTSAEQLLAAVAPSIAEPPAVPKRVTVLEQMPLTAIGKIYKPALRTQAAQRKLAEVVAAAGPRGSFSLRAVESAEGASFEVLLVEAQPAEVSARLKAAVAELPVGVSWVPLESCP